MICVSVFVFVCVGWVLLISQMWHWQMYLWMQLGKVWHCWMNSQSVERLCVFIIDEVEESQRCVSSNREHMKRTYYHMLQGEILEEVKNGKPGRGCSLDTHLVKLFIGSSHKNLILSHSVSKFGWKYVLNIIFHQCLRWYDLMLIPKIAAAFIM